MLKIKNYMFKFAKILEILISVFIIIAIFISIIPLIQGLEGLWKNPEELNSFRNYIGIVFNVIISIELLKMIYKSNLGSVVELLVFAISRQLIVEHTTILEYSIGVVSIAILFIIRKFLFIPKIDSDDEDCKKIHPKQDKKEIIE